MSVKSVHLCLVLQTQLTSEFFGFTWQSAPCFGDWILPRLTQNWLQTFRSSDNFTSLNFQLVIYECKKLPSNEHCISLAQMSTYLVDGKIITEKIDILNMWAGHFETIGTPFDNITYDKSFFQEGVVFNVFRESRRNTG